MIGGWGGRGDGSSLDADDRLGGRGSGKIAACREVTSTASRTGAAHNQILERGRRSRDRDRSGGKVAVMPDFPIVMPVAWEAPIEIVPVASRLLFESPVILFPVKVRAANTVEIPTVRRINQKDVRKARSRFGVLIEWRGEVFIAPVKWIYLNNK